jgi:hypothetical protein
VATGEADGGSAGESVARAHLGLVISGALAVLVVLKVLAVSHQRPTTALAILQTAGTANVLFGTLVLFFPAVFAVGVVVLWLVMRQVNAAVRYPVVGLAVLAWLYVMLTQAPSYLVYLLLFALAVVGVGVLALVKIRPGVLSSWRESGKLSAAVGVGLATAISLMFVLIAVSPTPWLPAERIVLGGGPGGTSPVGYVLGVDDGAIVFLHEDSRTVFRIPTSIITSRTYCVAGSQKITRPVIEPGANYNQFVKCDNLLVNPPP